MTVPFDTEKFSRLQELANSAMNPEGWRKIHPKDVLAIRWAVESLAPQDGASDPSTELAPVQVTAGLTTRERFTGMMAQGLVGDGFLVHRTEDALQLDRLAMVSIRLADRLIAGLNVPAELLSWGPAPQDVKTTDDQLDFKAALEGVYEFMRELCTEIREYSATLPVADHEIEAIWMKLGERVERVKSFLALWH